MERGFVEMGFWATLLRWLFSFPGAGLEVGERVGYGFLYDLCCLLGWSGFNLKRGFVFGGQIQSSLRLSAN